MSDEDLEITVGGVTYSGFSSLNMREDCVRHVIASGVLPTDRRVSVPVTTFSFVAASHDGALFEAFLEQECPTSCDLSALVDGRPLLYRIALPVDATTAAAEGRVSFVLVYGCRLEDGRWSRDAAPIKRYPMSTCDAVVPE